MKVKKLLLVFILIVITMGMFGSKNTEAATNTFKTENACAKFVNTVLPPKEDDPKPPVEEPEEPEKPQTPQEKPTDTSVFNPTTTYLALATTEEEATRIYHSKLKMILDLKQ